MQRAGFVFLKTR